jgi:ribosome-associated heat shock protein Hsp15
VSEASAPVRVDKWVWAVRLAKTRAIAHDLVTGGLVRVNGRSAKPSKEVGPGDRVDVVQGYVRKSVVVLGTAERRVSAPQAALLYEETAESRERRERQAEERRLAWPAGAVGGPRPTKRDRRRFDRTSGARRRGT